jgi:hypothetical protein
MNPAVAAGTLTIMRGESTMKTLITASALTLIANLALADDIYRSFASPELDSSVSNNYGVVFPSIVPSAVRVSLYDFYKGNPDVSQDLEGYVEHTSWASGRLTSYDRWLIGNPDSGPGIRVEVAPRVVALK